MAMSVRYIAVCLAVLEIFLVRPPTAEACSFTSNELLTLSSIPDTSFEAFIRGELGIVRATYNPELLLVAYRHMTGLGLRASEQDAILQSWASRRSRDGENSGDVHPEWAAARGRVEGAGPAPKMQMYGRAEGSYEDYLNCPADALRTAATTLDQRIATFGASSQQVKSWLQAQDQVFSNCGGERIIPAPADPASHPLIRADRRYQIAAAHFYAGNFELAEAGFREIAKDPTTPWRRIAPYLVARTLVRKGTLRAGAFKYDLLALTQAQDEMKAILSNPAQKDLHAAAMRLLGFVRFRLAPEERIAELGRSLLTPIPGDNFVQDLLDYHRLVHRLEDHRTLQPLLGRIRSVDRDDFTDWLFTFAQEGATADEHPLQRWTETGSIPWLVAALARIPPSHRRVVDLLQAAARINPKSPAALSVRFYSLRLMIESGRLDDARRGLASLLSTTGQPIPPASRNLLLALQLRTARNMDELLAAASRVQVGISDEEGEYALTDAGSVRLDWDFVTVMNDQMPLARWIEAVTRPTLPGPLRLDLAQAVWMRAILLGNEQTAVALVPILEKLWPEANALITGYLKAPSGEARRFAGVLAILHSRALRPYLQASWSEPTRSSRNWWCELRPAPDRREWAEDERRNGRLVYPAGRVNSPSFLEEKEQAAAKAEREKISATPTAPNYLAAEVIRWAEANRTDSRVPEALYLVVQATRYGCRDEDTPKFSRQAFRLLHQRYPKSPWTAKTPYWY